MDNNLQAKVIGTVIALFSWLTFIVLYLAFFAGGLDFWQKMAVFIASGSVLICIIAVMWIKWAMK
jgi:hypothetical protein